MIEKKARILLVDNDERTLKELSDLLTVRNYEVKVVELNGKDIVAAAATLAQKFRPHVAVIDLRIHSEFMDDKAGLDVYRLMTSAKCILYSAYLTAEVTQDALEKGFYKCLRKGGGSTRELLRLIEEAATLQSSRQIGWNLLWPPNWTSEEVINAIMEDMPDLPADLLDDIALQLLGEQDLVFQMETIEGDMRTDPSVSQFRSFVMKVRPRNRQPFILKFTDAKRAIQERRNYNQFIKEQVPGLFYTRLEKSRRFWDMAGTVYSFLGSTEDSILSFTSYYQNHQNSESILRPLGFLFNRLWRENYRNRRSSEAESLFELYDKSFDLTNLLQKISRDFEQKYNNSIQANLPNPGEWIAKFKDSTRAFDIYEAVTHGDLHGDNLFVDGEHVWLIDFERAGYGHILRDFVELENSIVVYLIPAEISIEEIQKLMFVLSRFQPTEDDGDKDILKDQPDLLKAYEVIMALRNIARQIASPNDDREYIWSLIFGTAKVASMGHIPDYQQERALLYTSLLCERRKKWNAPWLYTNLFGSTNTESTIKLPDNLELSGPDLGRLNDVLCSAFTSDTLEHLLLYYLDKDLYILTVKDGMRVMIHNILMTARRGGWLGSLIQAAYDDQSGNPKLKEFYNRAIEKPYE